MRKTLLCVLILLFCAIQVTAEEFWYESYEAGKKAVAVQQWGVAEQKLSDAIRKGPKQGRRVLAYGQNWVVYIPDYYLGVVYYNEGKLQQSLDQFKRVQSAGLVTQSHPEFAVMSKMIQSANQQLNPPQITQPTAPKPEEIEAKKLASELEAFDKDIRANLANGNIEEAKKELENLKQKDPNYSSIPTLSGEVDKAEKIATEELKKRQVAEEEQKKQQNAFELMQQATSALQARKYSQARKFVRDAAASNADPGQVDALLKKIDLEESLETLKSSVKTSNWTEAQRLSKQILVLDRNNQDVLALQQTIRDGLLNANAQDFVDSGILAYYSGQYQQAAELLAQAIAKQESAEAHFYLGCSYAAMALLHSKDRQTMLSKASQEFRKTHQLDNDFDVNQRSISPRIASLFNQTR